MMWRMCIFLHCQADSSKYTGTSDTKSERPFIAKHQRQDSDSVCENVCLLFVLSHLTLQTIRNLTSIILWSILNIVLSIPSSNVDTCKIHFSPLFYTQQKQYFCGLFSEIKPLMVSPHQLYQFTDIKSLLVLRQKHFRYQRYCLCHTTPRQQSMPF